MAYRLRDNLFYCVCGGRTVFLDVNANRYFCLPAPADIAFRHILGEGPHRVSNEETLRPLLSRGLLIPDPTTSGIRPPACIAPPTHDLSVSADLNPPLKTSAQALLIQLSFAMSLKQGRLADIKRNIERRVPRQESVAQRPINSVLSRISMAFAIADRILSPADRCLVRSLAFHAICNRNGVSSSLVIGVRTNPFAAHCWVQRDECILTGDFEQARLFTPIMVIQ